MSISFPSRLLFREEGFLYQKTEKMGGEMEAKKVLETFELITTLYDSRWTHEEIRLVLAVGVKVELLMDDHGPTI